MLREKRSEQGFEVLRGCLGRGCQQGAREGGPEKVGGVWTGCWEGGFEGAREGGAEAGLPNMRIRSKNQFVK